MAPYPIIADIASESTTIAGEIAASPELRLDPDQRPVATWTLDDGTACLASVQTDPEAGPIRTLIVDFVEHAPSTRRPSPSTAVPSPWPAPTAPRVPPRPVRRLGPPPPPPE